MAHPIYHEADHSCCTPGETKLITLAKGQQPTANSLIQSIWDNRTIEYNYEQFELTASFLNDAIARGWQKKKAIKLAKQNPFNIGLEFGEPDYETLQMFELNTYRFAAAKTGAMVQELNSLAKDADTFNDFRKNASKLTKLYNESYLRTEYDFAWNASHNAAQYHRQQSQIKNFPIWQYKTVGDDRVRQAHAALNGMKFKANDPIWDSIYPPNGWGCRCYVKTLRSGNVSEGKQAIKKLQTSSVDKNGVSEWDRMIKGGFNKNRAKTNEIFDIGRNYLKKDLRQKLSWKDQGLQDYKDLNQSKFPDLKTIEKTKEEAFSWAKENPILNDYNKRKISLHPKSTKNHLKKPGRENLIELIPEIIQAPSEVYFWNDGNKRDMIRYIKFYNGKVLNVVALIKDNQMQVQSWYEITKNLQNEKRVGILIKKL